MKALTSFQDDGCALECSTRRELQKGQHPFGNGAHELNCGSTFRTVDIGYPRRECVASIGNHLINRLAVRHAAGQVWGR